MRNIILILALITLSSFSKNDKIKSGGGKDEKTKKVKIESISSEWYLVSSAWVTVAELDTMISLNAEIRGDKGDYTEYFGDTLKYHWLDSYNLSFDSTLNVVNLQQRRVIEQPKIVYRLKNIPTN